ncbi:MAG: O-antigen ligase family protein [Lachnospiraceae bacterium]|nr:O-antigen ligase family protein [Lachnospiraceae bacterium]
MEKIRKNKKQKIKKQDTWKLLPLQFVLAVLPLILYVYEGFSGYSAYAWSSVHDFYVDIFLHGKMVAFSVLAILLLPVVIGKTMKMRPAERKEKLIGFIPLFAYLGFVILSTICSVNMEYSLYGSMDAKEPVSVLVGYVVVAFYAFVMIESAEDLKKIIPAAIVGGGCMAVLGVLQAAGKDPITSEFVQRLVFGKEFMETYGGIHLKFPVGTAYGTLFNPNYVGTYVAMYAPMALAGFILYKKWWKKLGCAMTFVGLLVTLFASQSRTGLIACVAVVVIVVFFRSRELWKYWYLVIPGITFVVMAFSLIDTYRDNLLTNRLRQMFEIRADDSDVKGVDTTGNGVRVLYKDTEYTVRRVSTGSDFNYVVLEGKAPKEVRYNADKTYGYFTLDNGDEIEIQTANYEGVPAFGLYVNDRYFYFTNQIVRENYKFINTEFGRLDECVYAKNVFPGYEAVASGRGYVWGRTIPLLKKNVFVGSGPDTFCIEFPQNDYVARYKSGYDAIFFTRPHNFYLQMGIQTGVLSLLAFLTCYLGYFIGSCKRYFFRKFHKTEQWIGFFLFACTVGFMVSGLANDSLITVTPIFYVLLGTGMAINQKICLPEKKEKKEEKGLK